MTQKVVVIDPGHNGANGKNPGIINQQVPAGFGQHKACNTTGTQTDGGYTEATSNWHIANFLKAELEAKGITVVMTRDSNDGVGPCINERAAIGNDNNAAAVISIHSDGAAASMRGFYVMTAARNPASEDIAAQSRRLATDIRDGLLEGDFPASSGIGSEGLWQRGDLGGLNLSIQPTVMLELGNMKNATDAQLLSTEEGQRRYARAIAAGVLSYLVG